MNKLLRLVIASNKQLSVFLQEKKKSVILGTFINPLVQAITVRERSASLALP